MYVPHVSNNDPGFKSAHVMAERSLDCRNCILEKYGGGPMVTHGATSHGMGGLRHLRGLGKLSLLWNPVNEIEITPN